MIYLVYQTTPLLDGIRPIMAYTDEAKAKEYCKRMNGRLVGYAYVAIPVVRGTQNAS